MSIPRSTDLDAAAIAIQAPQFAVEVHDLIESTQSLARGYLTAGKRGPLAVFARAQSAGRGQRGRVWHSPADSGLYLSVLWRSQRAPSRLLGLSLVVGLAVRACLARFGIYAQLKWPNDIVMDMRKLGGILVEIAADGHGSSQIIGIGLNYRVNRAAAGIDQPWTDICSQSASSPPLDTLAGALLQILHNHLEEFEAHGLTAFQRRWAEADALAGKPVWLNESGLRRPARALGINAAGQLLVLDDGRQRALATGDAQVRADD